MALLTARPPICNANHSWILLRGVSNFCVRSSSSAALTSFQSSTSWDGGKWTGGRRSKTIFRQSDFNRQHNLSSLSFGDRSRVLTLIPPARTMASKSAVSSSSISSSPGRKESPAQTSSPIKSIDKDASCDDKKQEEEQTESTPAAKKDEQLSTKDKLKQAVRDYGATVIVFHVTMSLTSLGFFYLLVSSGLDVVSIIEKLGIGFSVSKIAEGASQFVVAYAIHKVFAPLRITITLGVTPLIVRKLRSMGILKVKPKSSST